MYRHLLRRNSNIPASPNHPPSGQIISESSDDDDSDDDSDDENVEEDQHVFNENPNQQGKKNKVPFYHTLFDVYIKCIFPLKNKIERTRRRGILKKQQCLNNSFGLVCKPGFCKDVSFRKSIDNYCFFCEQFHLENAKTCTFQSVFRKEIVVCGICRNTIGENSTCKESLLYSKNGCGHIFHGYCLFLMFGGCECDFSIHQMVKILGNQVGVKDISQLACPYGCNRGENNKGDSYYTRLRLC